MHRRSLSHLDDAALLRDLASLVAHDRSTTAAILAHLAEVEARGLHLRAARAARDFPVLFDFPKPDVPTRVEPAGPPPALEIANKGPVTGPIPSAPARVNDGVSSRVAPLAAERYSLQLTMRQELHDKLRHAQRLLGHVVRPGDVAAVLERALDVLIEKLEKRKCGAAARRGPRRASRSARHIPAHVREAVWARDGGRCTFVGDGGRRCESREQLEYDHVVAVARGGEATVEGTRLLCRAHNQYEAGRTFGAGFMEEKRAAAREAREAKRAAAEARKAAESDPDTSVIPWLRSLGVRAEQAKRAAEAVAHLVDASLEERVKAAFAFHGSVRFPNSRRPSIGAAMAT